MKILNIGCGFNKIEGAVNLDFDERCNPDILADITNPLPYDDNTFDEVRAIQVLEHIFNFEFVMREVHRVLKVGGIFKVSVPMFPCRNAFAGGGHVRQFVPETFTIYTNPSYFQPRRHPSNNAGLFDIIKMEQFSAVVEGEEKEGEFITDLNVILKKVDKNYWKSKGIQKQIKNNVFGCFYCQNELQIKLETPETVIKICPKCHEEYEILKNELYYLQR